MGGALVVQWSARQRNPLSKRGIPAGPPVQHGGPGRINKESAMQFESGYKSARRYRGMASGDRSAADRILILTSGLGFGHVRAAQAIEAALLQQQVHVQILDLWSLINPGATSIIHQTYLRLVQEYPELYERLYQLDEHTWRQILESEEGPPASVMEVLELISEIASNSVAENTGVQYASDRLLLSMLYTSLPYDRASLAGCRRRRRAPSCPA